jgi:hypothetical protein
MIRIVSFVFVVQANMSSEISLNLLVQAKEQLYSGDFESAAKSARAVIALDESNLVLDFSKMGLR